ncbi:uncharacterized protein LOC128213450 [Mya arenaria]|uniref:uncharacterized protein LOC128213450 n=1 Tax=Mya arenaria TaxID=6604 RepID=UPI0022E36A83|nr:uncharacterized protein LOC128213450 [Mya arenaria]
MAIHRYVTDVHLDIDDIRLVGGVRSSFGTVEIKVGGKWGTICGRSYDIENYADYNVSEHEARQLCKMLGFMNDNVNFKIGTHFMKVDRPVFIDKLKCPENATHIDNCTYSRVPECYHDDLVALYCDGSDISTRLTGESSPYNGEVELYGWSTDSGGTNNSWTKVCGQSFNNHLATLACTSLGLRLTSSRKMLFNDLEGFLLEIQCHGHETSLQECDFRACAEVTDHSPLTAVHLTCSECGLPSNFYGEVLNVSTDGRIMHGQCSSGDTWFPVEMECINGSWTYTQSSLICDKIGIDDIRLVDGMDAYSGRVEILIDGVWGTLCGSSFDSTTWDVVFAVNVASTLCNMALNTTEYGSRYWSSAFYNTEFGPGNGPVFIDKIRCPLSGTHIDNCTYSRVSHCDKHNILSVSCEESNNVVPVLEDVRLVSGNSVYDGIPEVFVSGGWWAVMPNKINEEFATVVCTMLGKNFTALMQEDGEIEAPLFGITPVCTGLERHVNECGVVPGYNSYVQYNTSIHVLCTECGKLDTFDGHVREYNISSREVELICGALCPHPDYMTSTCQGDGVWTTVSNCSVNCGNKAELQNVISGSVILSISGVPGTLCGDGFTAENAVVMCSQYRWHQQESHFVAENVDINESSLVDTVYNFAFHCKGTETNLFQCVAMQLSSCKQNSVVVQCFTDADATNCNSNIMDVRLSGGSGPLDGRLEVFSVGEWGVVDQRLFTKTNDGQLVCSAFNSSFSGLLYQYISTEERVPLLFGRMLTCTDLLDNCVIEPYSDNLLGFGSCGQEFIYNYTYMDGQLYRVLNDVHENVDSVHLFCTDCGIPDINGGHIVSYESSTKTLTISCGLVCAGPEVLVDIICLGNASWSDHVDCYNLCESVNSVGLLNTWAGHVIMTIDGVTGVLCADNFDANALSVSCKNSWHDYPTTRSFSVQQVAIEQSDIVSTIFNYSFKCSGSELSLLECTYTRSAKCTGGSVYVKCIQEQDFWVDIAKLTPMGVRLFGGNSPYEGRLQVQAGGLWGSVDGQAFNEWEGEFVCSSLKKRLTSFVSVITENKTELVHFTDMSCVGPDNNFYLSYCKVTPYQLRDYFEYFIDLEQHVYQNGIQFALLNNQLNKTNDVSIICTDCGLPSIIGGKIDAYDFSTNTLTVDCGLICTGNLFLECFDNGSWSDIANCSSFCGTQNNIDLLHFTFGEVIVRKDDIPGTLCGDGFDLNDASVICRNKGIDNGIADVQFNAEMVDVNSSVVVQTTYNVDFQCNGMEYSLLECSYRTLDRCDSNAVYVSCIGNPSGSSYYLSDARLVDGFSPYSGRLEVYTMDTWATVVDFSVSFTKELGNMFCSHFSLRYTAFSVDTTSKMNTKPAISSDIVCPSYDQITSCWYYPFSDYINSPGGTTIPRYSYVDGEQHKILEHIYDHSRDVFLICTECGVPAVIGGQIKAYDHLTGTLFVDCSLVCSMNLTLTCLENGSWSDIANCSSQCAPTNDVDLLHFTFGEVILKQDGIPGTICGDYFDTNELDVVCRDKWISESYNRKSYSVQHVDVNSSPAVQTVYNVSFQCDGTENTLFECPFQQLDSCQINGVFVSCISRPWYSRTYFLSDVRLVDGNSPYSGRLEVFTMGSWATVVDSSPQWFSSGTVFCSRYDLLFSSYIIDTTREKKTKPAISSNIRCDSDQLSSCWYNPYSNNGDSPGDVSYNPTYTNIDGQEYKVLEEIYDHSRDIYLICTECGPISVENGEIVDISADGSILAITCNFGSVYETLEVHCINGTWNGTSNCEIAGYPLLVRDIRLADGNGPFDGRVEIFVGDTWGTICSDGFDMLDADFLCQTLQRKYISFPSRAGGFLTNAFYGEGTGPVYMDRLDCTAVGGNDLSHCYYVVNNTCTHSQDIAVVCHDCGPPNTFWDFDFFKWSGFSMIADCSFYRTYLGNLSMECSGNTGQNWETSGTCYEYSAPLEITKTRLVEGNSTNTGRVELEVHGYWGTICADGIGLKEAHVLCRMLGYSSAQNFYRNFTNPRTSGPIFVDELDCSETETSINDCSFETMHDCTHLQDIYLNCSACSTPAIPNGIANTSATIVGTVVEFVCRTNYRLEGNSVALCQPNRTWTDYPECILIDCDDPTPSHGQSSNTDTSHGAETTISCDEGYILSGMSEIVCQYNNTWTSYPVCNIIECNEPQPEFAEIGGNGTKYGDTLVVRCLEGYEPDGGTTIYCMFTGEWSEWQTCTIKDCGDPTPTGGFTNSTITTYGSAVHISCDPSFTILGSADIVCQATGTWSNLPICDPSDCGKFQIPNAQVDFTEGTSAGSKAYIRCNSGYTLNGASEALCDESGSWNDEPTCSLIDCGDFHISNGQVDEMTGNQFGDTMRVSCSTGYDLVGFSVIICNADGAWSNDPHCRIKDCGVPALSVNVKVASEGTQFGSIVTFNCNEGYRLVGPQRSECGSDGRWSDESPVCIAKVNIGGMCAGDDYCAAIGAECLNEVCKCPKTGIYDPASNTCDTMPEFPYGEDNGDTILNTNAQCSQAVRFEPGIPVSDELHTRIFVCANGYITLGEAYASPSPPNDLDSIASKIILGPFYAVMAPSGFVYYRKYDILTSPTMRSFEDVLLLEDIIHKYGGEDNFEAKFVLFVTWKDKKPYQSIFKQNSISTFQLALATDGWNTFVLFSYPKDKMNWSVQRTQKVDVWVGISVRGKKLFIDQYSNTPPVLQTDKTAATKDLRGAMIKRLSDEDSVLQNYAMECIDWYTETKYKTIEIIDISSRLPDCPCNTFSLWRDPWFTLNWRWWWWGNIDCIDMLPSERFSPYGKECCYDARSGLWISDEFPQAGGLYHHHPRTFPKEHIKTDSGPKDSCCVKSDFCHLYYELHPVGDCYRESWFNFGFFWGDPHIRTLDGKTFIFNGLGEYVLLMIRTNKTDVDLQARTKRAVKADGSLSQATIFTAFAAKDNFGARFHVELNTTDDGLVLYGNGADLTERFGTEKSFSFFPTGGNISMYRENDTLKIAFIESDVSFEITFGVGMLSLNAIVGKQYKGKTLGLLGNFDDKPDNDFVTPDNVVLAPNISESSIFQYGQSWEVTNTNSAFIYKDNEDHQTYQNNSFTPKFLSDADPEIVQNAIETCGEENIACTFDLVFTEDKSVAENTLERDMKSIELKVDNEKRTPKLQTCGSVWIHPGEATSCSIDYDDDTVEISIMDYNTTVANNVILNIDETEKTLSISAAGHSPSFDIRMTARNVDNMWSPIATVVVHYCTGCSEHGVCSNVTRVDARNTDLFKYMACVCEEQFNGTDCEDDFDGCASSPCSLGRTCSDIYNHSAGGSSYTCGGCPNGYIVDNNNCADINECQTNVSVCEQDCVNTDGSFQCSCNSGYRLSGNRRSCSDINECEEARHNCTQVCLNNDGGFACTCHSGFLFNETLWDCIIDTDYDPCLSADLDCRNTSGCTLNLANVTTCFCEDGFELDATGLNCKDVNECNRGACQQVCSNTVGGFECSCYQGYRIDGKTECIPCESPYYGINCSIQCACSSRGTRECNSVRGCVCEVGWKGNTCDDDVNECEDNPNICADPLTRCKNTEGSYFCQCITGYQKMTNGTCTDINECQIGTHNCSQQCVNNVGSYSCKCLNGYTRNGDLCDDIDECELGTSGCKQICENVPGQFNCFCYFGYELNSDRKSCIKISDPCLTLFNLTCEHYCVITDNNAQCRCEPGYELGIDQQTCIDINECQIDARNLCGQKGNCRNLIGSFRCECSAGWKLENDGRTCSECDAHHYGINCTGTCTCINGVCHKERGCECKNGWTGTSCEIDLNECETDHHDCDKYNDTSRTCVNTPGSFSCACRNGYHTVGGLIKCADVDECSDPRLNDCDQICENTDGDYTCSCHDGYQFVDGSCQDIDECKIRSPCEHLCENFDGGFRCSCFPGYNLNLTNRHSCIAKTECTDAEKSNCSEHSSCVSVDGNPNCVCEKGFEMDESYQQCLDVDECIIDSPCNQNCENLDGAFNCSCNVGFTLMADSITCRECESGFYGFECQSTCPCNQTNTVSCNSISGNCTCMQGWTNEYCDENVNECVSDTYTCPENSDCIDTDGNYICRCRTGYLKTGDNKCTNCPDWKFGTNCESSCTCLKETTSTCDKIEGTCLCAKGWTGDNCTIDINECEENNSICSGTPHSQCVNKDWSYGCECVQGYDDVDFKCEDVNECNQVSLNQCGQKDNCRNSEGSFSCFCSPGWKLEDDGLTCAECDGNHFGESCSNICNCVHGVCNRISGCMCDSGWEGDSCGTDVDECGFVDCTDQHPNTICVNTDGGYACNCKEGFHMEDDNSLCQDIDECAENLHDCDQICLNIEGSFECNCFDGFTRNNNSCKDIDECLDTSVCDQNCVNFIGGYNCSCEHGFTLADDNKTCSAITECNDEETADCPEKSTCAIIDAYPVCVCDNGYSMTENSICEDINECESGTTPCTQGCTNFPGAFSCTCEVGYSLLDDRVTCEECESWRYGENCTESCDCDNARSCDRATGECDCKQGWTSAKCDEDINECENVSLFECMDHSFCLNTDGGYLCVCERGYQQTEDETCSVCPEWSFGYGCKKQCACKHATSATCHHETGACTCIEGWTGNECSEDVNECVETPDICDNTANTKCVNVDATYQCECKDGYTDVSGLCADIDECLEDPCNQECTNTDGSYFCYCNPGFTEQNNVCKPCTDNTFGTNCFGACNCESSNVENASQFCDTVNGTCLCNQFWTGVTCNDDINECLIPSICANKPNSGCHNTRGGFICDCKRGYKLENSICVLDNQGQTTETPTAESFGVRRTVRIEYPVPDGTDFEVSATFTEFNEKIQSALRDLFTPYTAKQFTIVIYKISAGSLIVNFTVMFDDKNVDKNDKAAIAKAFVDLNAGKEIVVDGETFAAKLVEDGISDACDVYVEIIGNCAEGQTCRVANGDAVCSDDTPSGTNIALVVGLTIGCSVLIVGVLIALCIRKLRSESNQRKNETSRSRSIHTDRSGKSHHKDKKSERLSSVTFYDGNEWRTGAQDFDVYPGRRSIPGDQIEENFASMRIERSRPRNENMPFSAHF